MLTEQKTYTIYYAGDLFDQKHLTGNVFLSQQMEKLSDHRYKCMLPQDWEGECKPAIEIRNNDILSIIKADLIILNFGLCTDNSCDI